MPQSQNAQFSSPGVATEGSSFEAPFPVMGRPAAGSGELTVRLRKTEPEALTADVVLLQGTAVIASTTVSPTTAFADYSLGLTIDDVNELTIGTCNLSDLTVRVSVGSSSSSSSSSSGGTVQTACCEEPIPETLFATVSAPGCGLLDGLVIELTYDGSFNWFGQSASDICGSGYFRYQFKCDIFSFQIIETGATNMCGPVDGWVRQSQSCEPLEVVFESANPLQVAKCPCCSAPTTATITVTQ